jgi:hypothetical protein
MHIVPQGTGSIGIGQDIFLLGIMLGVVLMGLLIGYILRQRNHGETSRYPSTIFQTRGYHTKKFLKRVRSRRVGAVLIAAIWVLFLLFVLPIMEYHFQEIIVDISALFIIISFIIGCYNAYPLAMWIDRKIPHTDSGIWMRRIIACLMVLGGLGVAFLWLTGVALASVSSAIQGVPNSPYISILALIVLAAGFFFGIAVFGAYMEFNFERRSGGFVFRGRQRF